MVKINKRFISTHYQLVVKKVYKRKVFKILIVKGPTHKVIEKIGSFDPIHGKFVFNNFRFLFWISKNIRVHWRLFLIFNYFGINKVEIN